MNKIQYHPTTLILPRGPYNTYNEAVNHAKSMGYNTDMKKPDISDNYYKFKQFTPKDGEKYYAQNPQNGSKTAMSSGQHIHSTSIPIAKVPTDRLGANGHGIHYSHADNHVWSGPVHQFHHRPAQSEVMQRNLTKQMGAEARQLRMKNHEMGLQQIRKGNKLNY